MSSVNFEKLQQEAKCNWCRNPMVMSEALSEANLIDTGKKYPALYCSNCLAIEFRVRQPKTAINPDTLDEFIIEDMPDVKEQQEQQQEVAASQPSTTPE